MVRVAHATFLLLRNTSSWRASQNLVHAKWDCVDSTWPPLIALLTPYLACVRAESDLKNPQGKGKATSKMTPRCLPAAMLRNQTPPSQPATHTLMHARMRSANTPKPIAEGGGERRFCARCIMARIHTPKWQALRLKFLGRVSVCTCGGECTTDIPFRLREPCTQ